MKAKWIIFAILLVIVTGFIVTLNGVPQSPHVSREQMEMTELMAAAEAYKSDYGHYPSDPASSEQLDPNTTYDPAAYISASAFLYRCLSGAADSISMAGISVRGKSYLEFPSKMLRTNGAGVTYIVDPQGNSMGYSTFAATHPQSHHGYNPSFDL